MPSCNRVIERKTVIVNGQRRVGVRRCKAKWSGVNSIAHCGACHETFSSVLLFDLHRSAVGEHGSCRWPERIVWGPESARAGEPRMEFYGQPGSEMWRFYRPRDSAGEIIVSEHWSKAGEDD
jgi:hypothetical protein